MLHSSIIRSLLSNQDVPYRLVKAANPNNLTKTHASVSLLKDSSGIVMAIYNSDHQFDLSSLKAVIERPEIRYLSVEELEETLCSLKHSKNKPFNKDSLNPNNSGDIQLIIDEPMSALTKILLVTDTPEEYIQVDIWEIQVMIENVLIGGIFSHKNNPPQSSIRQQKRNLLVQLKEIKQLPVMPSMAANLLKLQANPEGSVDDMVNIISQDPALAVQILRYANSALFGFSGQIKNLHDAIFRVLGYETVLYMSLGAALARAFKLPQSGRLSMSTFWKEATYRAALCQQLASRMPKESQPSTSIAFISGLLHNIGVVLMGNIFQAEFNWLNKVLSIRPQQSLITTELNLFGCTHTSVGHYLMKHWKMPDAITVVVGEHHTAKYRGDQETYVWLTQLAGQALQSYDLSDSDNKTISEELCQQLELTELNVEEALAAVMKENNALDAMASTLCA